MDTWKPAYRRVADEISRRIEVGEYDQGARLSEAALCAEFNVSRITVKKALEILVIDGLITRTVGRGTFVRRRRRPEALSVLGSIEEIMTDRGIGELHVLSRTTVPANADVAEHLHVEAGSPVLEIAGLRIRDGKPFKYQAVYLPDAIATRLPKAADFKNSTIIQIIESHLGLVVTDAEQTITAEMPTPQVARMLELPRNTPLLVTRRTFFSKNAEPVQFAVSCYSSLGFAYAIRLRRSRD